MDAYEVTRIVYARVQSLEPENVSKIIGYLLLQDNRDQQMLHLAFGPDALLQAMILRAKKELGLLLSGPLHGSAQLSSPHLSNHAQLPVEFSPLSQPSLRSPSSSMDYLNSMYVGVHGQQDRAGFLQEQLRAIAAQNLEEHAYLNFNRPAVHDQLPPHEILTPFEKTPLYSEQGLRNEYQPSGQFGFLNNSPEQKSSLNVFPNDSVYPDMYAIFNGGKLNVDPFHTRSNGSLSVSPESTSASAWKPCLYYARGYCKHGSNCRFLHSHLRPDPLSPLSLSNGQRDTRSDGSLSPGTSERLELELQDLLRGRRAPVSIASLPQLYYERYGKTLQAEGYLTESQRHGKAGYSLTKLLARLKNTVTVIDRPHGQHAVVLAEEAYKFLAYRGERDDLSGVNPGSRQIYLTFPAESTFTEEDVSAHFRAYGPVQDVRIPYQQKRMFGFVTFVYSDTVKTILAKGNPHYICGARVLVKPYKEKGKHSERKFSDRGEHSRYQPSHGLDGSDFDFPSGFGYFNDHELAMQKQLKEQEQILELERQQLADLQLAGMQRQFTDIVQSGLQAAHAQSTHGLNGLGQSEELARTPDMHQIQASSTFGYLLDVLDGDQGEELGTHAKGVSDLQSGHNLPDSPFTSPRAQTEAKGFSLSEMIKNLSLDRQDAGPVLSAPTMSEGNTHCTCRICMGFFVDPIQLDCNHVFCVQCILKVIRVSKDECPICRQHIGSQIVKLLESRGLQVIDLPLARRGGAQTMW